MGVGLVRNYWSQERNEGSEIVGGESGISWPHGQARRIGQVMLDTTRYLVPG